MPLPTYPTALPNPSGTLSDRPAERRDVAGRPGAFRVAGTARERIGTLDGVTWVLALAQVPTWQAWWRDDLVLGGAWFTATWPSREGPAVSRAYRFASEPRWEHVGRGQWRVTAALDYRPDAGVTDAPAPAPPAAAVNTLSLMRFNASPLVDEVSTNTITTLSGSLAGSPAIAGSSLQTPLGTGLPNIWRCEANTPDARTFIGTGLTVEAFIRRPSDEGSWQIDVGVSSGYYHSVATPSNHFAAIGFSLGRGFVAFSTASEGYGGGYFNNNTSGVASDIVDFTTEDYPAPVALSYSTGGMDHVAVVFYAADGTGAMYFNGTRVQRYKLLNNAAIPTALTIGEMSFTVAGRGASAPAFIDEYRASRVARYSGTSFTPPTGPFTLD